MYCLEESTLNIWPIEIVDHSLGRIHTFLLRIEAPGCEASCLAPHKRAEAAPPARKDLSILAVNMLLRVQNINALDLCDAAAKGDVDRVESLLASGVDPNARWDDLAFPLSAAADDDDWASREKSARPPIVFCDFTETLSLGLASQDGKSSYPDKRTTARIMTALLQHGADPYALYRQPIYTYRDLPLFPGETKDSQFDTEDIDLLALSNNRRTILDRELQLHRRQQRLAQGVPAQKADECLTVEEIDYDNATEYESRLPLHLRFTDLFKD